MSVDSSALQPRPRPGDHGATILAVIEMATTDDRMVITAELRRGSLHEGDRLLVETAPPMVAVCRSLEPLASGRRLVDGMPEIAFTLDREIPTLVPGTLIRSAMRASDEVWRPTMPTRAQMDAWVATDPYHRLRALPDIGDEQCRCRDHPPLKLMPARGPNPLHCMSCSLPVAPESIPLPLESTDDTANWGWIARAFGTLDFDSREYEELGRGEQENLDSALNRRGRELSFRLSPARRTYLWWNRGEQRIRETPVPACPVCGETMIGYPASRIPVVACNGCHIATSRGRTADAG